jgi:hypothetical protein
MHANTEQFITGSETSYLLPFPSVDLLVEKRLASDSLEAALTLNLESLLGDWRLATLPLAVSHCLFEHFYVERIGVDEFIEFVEMSLIMHYRLASMFISSVDPCMLIVGHKIRLLASECFDWNSM